jgi:acyl-CoA dehydrogenase
MTTTQPNEEHATLLAEVVSSLLEDRSTPEDVRRAEAAGGFAPDLWQALAETGLPWVSVPEESGGSGGTLRDALAMQRLFGRFAAPVPVAETGLLAGWLQAAAGITVLPALTTAAMSVGQVTAGPERDGLRLTGTLRRVPFGRHCVRLVLLLDDGTVAAVPLEGLEIVPGTNLAGEPRDTVHLGGVLLPSELTGRPTAEVSSEAFLLRARMARVLAMAGAMERVLDLTVRYANEREQFGRRIGRFQAVQAHIVKVAEETACARISADVAAEGLASGLSDAPSWVAMAAVTAADAARVVTAAAHQVHGAIGMTDEYPLGLFSRRLWSWRNEYGSERYWRRRVGDRLLDSGADQVWPLMTSGLVRS